jgi:hypothetical protein
VLVSYIDTILARYPPGTVVYGGCPRPRKEASKSKGATMNGASDEAAPVGLGHNRPDFDEVARANLKRGLHLTHLEVITRAIDDPRLDMCALQVLAHIIRHMNGRTAIAYPGRERLAAEIIYHVNGEPRHYSPKVIGNAVSKLIRCGYLISTKRAPRPGAHAVSHYTVVYPLTLAEWWAEIEAWCRKKRAEEPREFPRPADVTDKADVIAGDDVTTGDDVIAGDDIRLADVIAGNAADVIAGDENRQPSLITELESMNSGGADAPGVGVASPDGKANPKVEARSRPKRATPAAPPGDAVAAFERFWAAFPPGRKTDKGGTRDLFVDIVTGKHKKRRASAEVIVAAAERYAATRPDPQYTPMPKTWLNGGRWEDDICQPRAQAVTSEEAELAATLERMRAEEGWQ